ncbi:hypothetical protein SAMN05216302_100964 [Nitrosomonas aestuarii]|uniref:Uncharacterized protein n=1 Tax=Nitrosomonas aestuarii TaxID=52441 RepID=A0A1I4AJE4_9PROT|nr:hypothetical protein [Nitrosomonas aestuarii]SFK56622.1 hypothetical protein SAMN05216302_100964 [Nitrosomonas aestuarii]
MNLEMMGAAFTGAVSSQGVVRRHLPRQVQRRGDDITLRTTLVSFRYWQR